MSIDAADRSIAEKISAVFRPLLDETRKLIVDSNTVQYHALEVKLDKLSARFDVIEALLSEKKKTTTRAAKTTTEPTPAAAVTPATTVQPSEPAPAPKTAAKTYGNKLLFFKDRYVEDSTYRAKYLTPAIETAMNADGKVNAKTNAEAKLIAQAGFCYSWIKINTPEVLKSVDKDYADYKAGCENAAKGPQLTVEPKKKKKTA